jgi:hypothetical protein
MKEIMAEEGRRKEGREIGITRLKLCKRFFAGQGQRLTNERH